jgi:hypothetical protein
MLSAEEIFLREPGVAALLRIHWAGALRGSALTRSTAIAQSS